MVGRYFMGGGGGGGRYQYEKNWHDLVIIKVSFFWPMFIILAVF